MGVFIDGIEYVPKIESETFNNDDNSKDAERYRWLRDYGKCTFKFDDYCETTIQFNRIMNLQMKKLGKDFCIDAAVDMAMNEDN